MPKCILSQDNREYDGKKEFVCYVIENKFRNRTIICQFMQRNMREKFCIINLAQNHFGGIDGTRRSTLSFNLVKEYQNLTNKSLTEATISYSLNIIPLDKLKIMLDSTNKIVLYANTQAQAFRQLCENIMQLIRADINPEELPIKTAASTYSRPRECICFSF